MAGSHVQRVVGLATALLLVGAAGCSGQSHGSAAPRKSGSVPGSRLPSSNVRQVRVGEEWTVPPYWRIKVTKYQCGPGPQLLPGNSDYADQDVCDLEIAYTNTGNGPNAFSGDYKSAGPASEPVGFDAQGRQFEGTGYLTGVTNPGLSDTTTIDFKVPTGVRIVRARIDGAMVNLG